MIKNVVKWFSKFDSRNFLEEFANTFKNFIGINLTLLY